jgi:hypothetical protein
MFKKITTGLATLALVLLTSVIAGAYSQTSNELLTWANMNTATSDGTFVLSASGYGSCSYGTSAQIVVGATFNGCEYNNGGCSVATEDYTFSQYQACALFNYAVDGFMVSSGTDWPTLSGSPSFVAYSYPGGSGSDKMVEGPLVSAAVYQALSNGQTIGSGHAISVKVYMYNQEEGYTSTTCTGTGDGTTVTTVYGSNTPSAAIHLGSTSGTTEASASLPSTYNAWTQETLSFTTPSAGVYYLVLTMTPVGVVVHHAIPDPVHNTCAAGTNTTNYGNGYLGNVTTTG